MSPYLFVMCMDKLTHLIAQSVVEGEWKGLKAGRNGPVITHLMFADNLLVFGQANVNQMATTLRVLNQFCSILGQEINQQKTSLMFSKNVKRDLRDELVTISGLEGILESQR